MNLRKATKLILYSTLVIVYSCSFNIKNSGIMPNKMPADVEIVYNRSAGMLPENYNYELSHGICNFKIQHGATIDSGTYAIPQEEIIAAYQQLKIHDFDQIKIQAVLAYDAGNTTICIYWNNRNNHIVVNKNISDNLDKINENRWNTNEHIVKQLFKIR